MGRDRDEEEVRLSEPNEEVRVVSPERSGLKGGAEGVTSKVGIEVAVGSGIGRLGEGGGGFSKTSIARCQSCESVE